MKILISPAKQMKHSDIDFFEGTQPLFLEEAHFLVQELRSKSLDAFQSIMHCSTAIAQKAYHLYQTFEQQERSLALFSYKGIQYQYMAPDVLEDLALAYLQKHLMILSGLYGLLRPFDWIAPYRLEMQARLPYSLYDFWQNKLADSIHEDLILNLASEEYAKAIRPYKKMIDVRFFEETGSKRIEKGVYVKMARGQMVRYLAQNQINDLSGVQSFHEAGYCFQKDLSSESEIVFTRKTDVSH